MIRFIAALDSKQGIADDHGLPWQGKIPTDINYYHDKIEDADNLMGFGLYLELPKPYPNRKNYVATLPENPPIRTGFEAVYDPVKFLEDFKQDIWNLGGALLFASTLHLADELYITQLDQEFKCTKFFPDFKDKFEKVSESEPHTENGITFTFQVWRPK
ncbi:MAG TPA: dihydrofolate reductase [Candidatus Saccharimonadales bacterium]|nr:dihydrofolate reductase [Candidatus Saccharimonadales bacterium]